MHYYPSTCYSIYSIYSTFHIHSHFPPATHSDRSRSDNDGMVVNSRSSRSSYCTRSMMHCPCLPDKAALRQQNAHPPHSPPTPSSLSPSSLCAGPDQPSTPSHPAHIHPPHSIALHTPHLHALTLPPPDRLGEPFFHRLPVSRSLLLLPLPARPEGVDTPTLVPLVPVAIIPSGLGRDG